MAKAATRKWKMKVGDWALVGGSSTSLPCDWFLGEVLLVDGDHVAIRHHGIGGMNSFRQFFDVDCIRAIGTISQLAEIQEAARKEVKELAGHVRELEAALGIARQAVFKRLRELSQDNIRMNPEPAAPAEETTLFMEQIDKPAANLFSA